MNGCLCACGVDADAGTEVIGVAAEESPDGDVVSKVRSDASVGKATSLNRSLSQKCLASGQVPDGDSSPQGADTLKRHKSVELDKIATSLRDSIGRVRVRTAAGSLVLSLTREECVGMVVRQLKVKVLDVAGRSSQLKLLVAARELQDAEKVDEIEADGEVLEILLLTSEVPRLDPEKEVFEQLDVLKGMIMSYSTEYQLDGATHIRKLLSAERDPPIQAIIDLGIVPRLLALSDGQDGASPAVQFEALWGLTNIASGDTQQTQVVVQEGALPVLVKLLREPPSDDVFEQAVWAIGNIAGDSTDFRNQVQAAGAMPEILAKLEQTSLSLSLMRNTVWALSNLCRGKPSPDLQAVVPALPVLLRLLEHDDDEVLSETAWTISYISDGENDRIGAVVDAGVVPRLVPLLSHTSATVRASVVRAVGNIVTGDEEQTQSILDAGVLPVLMNLLNDRKKIMRKETCWTISNILAGSHDQIQAVIDAGLIPALLERLGTDDFEVRREAAWSFANASSGGTHEQIQQLVASGCLEGMADLLSGPDTRMTTVVLEFFGNVLAVPDPSAPASPDGDGLHTGRVRDAISSDILEALQAHESEDISEKAVAILEQLYPDEPDEEE